MFSQRKHLRSALNAQYYFAALWAHSLLHYLQTKITLDTRSNLMGHAHSTIVVVGGLVIVDGWMAGIRLMGCAPHQPHAYSSIECGSSKYFWKFCSHCAPTAPSTVRWSQLSVTVIKSLCFQPLSEPLSGTMRCCVPPTARMHDCGGLMTAQNWVMPAKQPLHQ